MFHFGLVWMPHVERWWFTMSVYHTDARQCSVFVFVVKVPMCQTRCFWIHATLFPVILPTFLYTQTHTHVHTHTNTFCDCKCGSPWRRDHSDRTHDLWVSARFIDTHTHTLAFYFCVLLIVLLSDFQYHVSVGHDARHINTKSTTIVLVYKYIPFFQHKVYTFFYRGGILSVVLQVVDTTLVNITTTSPPSPQRRVP